VTGRVVAITGASAGVGRAAASAFAAAGDHVALLARNVEALEAAAAEVRAHGVGALVCPVDVADAAAVEAAATTIEAELGPIDVWVNNAMTAVLAPVSQTSAEDFRRVTEVTYLGYVHGTLAALPRMQSRDRGVIVQVGSALSFRSIPLQATYCGAKHAIVGFTDALRTELLHDHSKVKVSLVHLAGMNTPQFGWVKTNLPRHPQPVPPIYQPEVAARAIVWMADHPRRALYVGAPTPLTIWAGRIVPGLVDRYLARTNYQAQQTDRPIVKGRPSNLDHPVPGDGGAHGIFNDQAHPRSAQLWLATHRPITVATTLTAAALAAVTARRCIRTHD